MNPPSAPLSPDGPLASISPAERLQLFEWLLRLSGEAVVAADAQGRILFTNRAAETLFAVDGPAVLGQPLEQLLSSDLHARHGAAVARFAAEGVGLGSPVPMGRVLARTPAGEELPLDAVLSQLDLGGRRVLVVLLRDRRAEVAEERARAMSQAVLDGLSGHIAVLDPKGTILAVNRAWREFAQESGGSVQVLCEGANYLDVCQRVVGRERETARRAAAAIRAVAAGEVESAMLEYPCPSPQTMRWFVARFTAMEGGSPRSVIVAHESITERKLNEMALAESEERYRALLETSFDWVWETDAEGRYTFASPRVAEVLGYAPEELLGRTPFELMPTSEAARIQAFFGDAVARGIGFRGLENVNLHRDGREVVLETSGLPIFDGRGVVVGYRGMDRDVTERKRAESELRQREARYAALIETSPDAILVNSDDRITLVNRACLRLFGAERPEQLLGRSPLELLDPDFHELIRARVRAMRESGEPVPPVEERIVRLDGSNVDVEVVAAPFDDHGRLGIHVVLRDLTERRRLEAARLASHRAEALGNLATGIAHDFNNLLLAIRGNARLAALEVPGEGEIRAAMSEIEMAARRGAELVRRILAFGRPEASRPELQLVRPLFAEALGLLRSTLPARIALVADLGPEDLRIEVDGSQLHQALVDLLTNAAQAIGEGEGRIGFRAATVELDSRAASRLGDLGPGRYLQIEVSDDGCGMSPEMQRQIFDPFFTTRPPGMGSGLGLSVVRGFAAGHGGGVSVHSEPNRGSTFRLYLPLQAPPRPESTASAAQVVPVPAAGREAPRGGRRRILYVDDDEALVFLARRLLVRRGFEVHGHVSPEDALAELRGDPAFFDALVTDLSMPRVSGLDLAAAALALRADLPVVLLSGYLRPEDEQAARRVGVRAMILKPDTVDALAETLDRLVPARATEG